ncbi:MAG: purine-nucleoside phosphorylase [Pseudomonadota bacterium]|nr:purine-nucleoside phosphorylase [Pseudomonadota bacterium]
MSTSFASINAKFILDSTDGFRPKFGLVLGSGLEPLAEQIQEPRDFSFSELKGFHDVNVKGHTGGLRLGLLFGVPVACLRGRSHYYEGHNDEAVRTGMRTLKLLGCDSVLLTNAAASTNPEVPPGRLLLIKDHLNFIWKNPLVGLNDDEFGTRFPPMDDAYDAEYRAQLLALAQSLAIPLTEGNYLAVLGPSYETPAEVRAFKMLGADAIGMSTVPEVIVARHCGLRVAAISTITNMACGLSDEKLSHDNVLKVANQATGDFIRLLQAFMEHQHVAA